MDKTIKTSEELLKELREIKVGSNLLLFFPIRPDFRDSKSLLGYYNPLTEKYHSTPLLEFMLKAAENYLRKGKEADPFFVLLDEMNLARVEYYFADFLSILEAKKFTSKEEALQNPNFREFLESLNFPQEELNEENFRFSSHGIKLHSEENLKNIPKELFLPPNIYFIGTINVDETTHAIAPKVLDRAFTLEFEVDDFEKYLKFLEKSNGADEIIEPSEELKKDFTREGKFAIIEKKTVKEYCNKNPEVVQLLNEINKILKRYGLHFGYRVFDEIVMFLYNSENSQFKLDKDTALDFAIKTKILPKFSGVRQRLEKPILELLSRFINTEETQIDFEKISSLPWFEENKTLKVEIDGNTIEVKTKYPQTVSKLLEMLYKLKTEGFATFIG
jgi:5-methylcytosine-specific restriction endonuclease McrBC GTP-binding regulatory subunit McrB